MWLCLTLAVAALALWAGAWDWLAASGVRPRGWRIALLASFSALLAVPAWRWVESRYPPSGGT